MIWPDRTICHGTLDSVFKFPSATWEPPDPESRLGGDDDMPPLPKGAIHANYGYPFRRCSYCGSIHPEDLYQFLTTPPDLSKACRRCERDQESEPSSDDIVAWRRWQVRSFEPHTCRVTLVGSDWKYGWPHKFYVEGIPNPLAGRMVVSGSGSRREGELLVRYWLDPAPAPTSTHAKFYNVHLLDLYDLETFNAMADLLFERTKIKFVREGYRLLYSAPYAGYQA